MQRREERDDIPFERGIRPGVAATYTSPARCSRGRRATVSGVNGMRTLLAIGVLACCLAPVFAEQKVVMTRATGTFDVKLAPVGNDSTPEGPNLGRMSLDKVFKGDIDAVGKGEMITAAGIAVNGSAAYSAVERITGMLHGKKGSFALQHTGIMDRGKPSLTITVVPDSATGELVGLTGKMDIIIEGKEHKYVFEYSMTKG